MEEREHQNKITDIKEEVRIGGSGGLSAHP